jgi:hypothetical protein
LPAELQTLGNQLSRTGQQTLYLLLPTCTYMYFIYIYIYVHMVFALCAAVVLRFFSWKHCCKKGGNLMNLWR